MWSHFPLRLCMAAMAPALTDAATHTGSFKLPASPANPGNSGLQASPNQPTSPDLPPLANGRSPGVPGADTDLNQTLQTCLVEAHDPPSPDRFDIRTRLLDNNNHHTKAKIEERNVFHHLTNGCNKKQLSEKLNSLISTFGTRLLTNGEGNTIKQDQHKTMSNPIVSLAQQGVLRNIQSSATSDSSIMPPLTMTPSQSEPKHNVNVAGLESRTESVEPESSDSAASPSDESSLLALSLFSLTPDANSEQMVELVNEKSETESDRESNKNHLTIPSEDKRHETHTEETTRSIPKPQVNVRAQSREKDKPKERIVYNVVDEKGDEDTVTESRASTSNMAHQCSKLEHRTRYLMEKLRRLQTCQTGAHVYQQVSSFVESKQPKQDNSDTLSAASSGCEECQRNRLMASKSGGDASLKRSSYNCVIHNNSRQDRLKSRTTWAPSRRTKPSGYISQHLRDGKQSYREVKSVTGRLRAGLGHVESSVDSDVTDSSSGGESCDEGDDSLPHTQVSSRSHHKVPLHRRASWKWATDRAAIASKWTWLQAQVSDLEYRIRQQSDIYRQIRATKGTVTLGEPPSPEDYLRAQSIANRTGRKLSPIEAKIVMLEGPNSMSPTNLSTLLSNVDRQSAKLKQSLQNCISPISGSTSPSTSINSSTDVKMSPARPLNGLMDNVKTPSPSLCGTNTTSTPNYLGKVGLDQTSSPVQIEEQYCARTRPVRHFRKRKLIRSTGLYQVSRKAQKLSTVHCGCCPPQTPCVMCGGRFNNVEQLDADQLPMSERVASLDYAFHSVLSFPEDIPLPLHFESLVKTGAWQRKHAARSAAARKRHNRVPNRSRIKVHTKDNRLKKFRRKEKQHHRRGSGDNNRKHDASVKKENQPTEVKAEATKEEGSANEDEDTVRSRKLLHRLARQKLKALRQVRTGKLLPRSRSQPSSVPSTPKTPLNSAEMRQCRTEIKKRRAAELAIAALKKSRERSLSLPNIELPQTAPSTPTPLAANEDRSPTQPFSHSLPSGSLQSILRHKKGIVEAYDIDNIVIPYSMLASTRVERLNYKEIVTPKWRVVDMEGSEENHINHDEADCEDNDIEEEEFDENLSDSEFLSRHNVCESYEKQKYLVSVVDQGIPGRRSRRSRNSSIGSAPDPHSPDLHLEHLSSGLQSPATPSTLSPSPVTTPDQWNNSGNSVFNLSASRSLRCNSLDRRRSSSVGETQMPKGNEESTASLQWEKREFPLTDAEVEEVNAYPESDPEPSTRPSSRASNITHTESLVSRTESQEMNSYISEAENSEPENMEVDDPNDPEWTVVEHQQRPRKVEGSIIADSLVLRLAKR